MNFRLAAISLIGTLVAIMVHAEVGFAVEIGQIDDFEIGTSQGWVKGANSTLQPTNINTDGPLGINDNYLQSISTGGIGADSKQVVFNKAQWTSDYLVAGITEISI